MKQKEESNQSPKQDSNMEQKEEFKNKPSNAKEEDFFPNKLEINNQVTVPLEKIINFQENIEKKQIFPKKKSRIKRSRSREKTQKKILDYNIQRIKRKIFKRVKEIPKRLCVASKIVPKKKKLFNIVKVKIKIFKIVKVKLKRLCVVSKIDPKKKKLFNIVIVENLQDLSIQMNSMPENVDNASDNPDDKINLNGINYSSNEKFSLFETKKNQ